MANKQDKQAAVDMLKEWLPEGTRLYGLVTDVSRSGMARTIRFFYVDEDDRKIREVPPSWIADAVGESFDKKRWGVRVSGCGMDIVFATIYALGKTLWGDAQAFKYETL